MTKMWVVPLMAAAVGMAAPAAAEAVQVETGQLRGSRSDGVTAYLGIPYAAPPTGNQRWRAPRPPARWSGVRDATSPAPVCPQVRSSPTQLSPLGAMAEDCLFLNVWAPAGRATKRPVMVWIHGGGFIAGAGSEAQFDGHALAKRGVILVTINYRLGRLGFFAHPTLEAEQADEPHGNYGLLDQIAALEWVRRNIVAFGGDPRNVTLFGQSAGGISVVALAATESAHGLFQKAIILSGTPLQSPRDIATDRPDKPSALTLGVAWASQITGAAQPTAAMLRALPADRVAPSAPTMPEVMDILAAAGPMIDGQLVTDAALHRFRRDGIAIPMIIGTTSRDALVWSFSDGKAQTLPFWAPKPEQIARNPADRAAIVASYVHQAGGHAAAGQAALAADILFGAGAFDLASKVASHSRAWLYRFDAVPASVTKTSDGAPHGTELFYAFGTLDRFPYRPEAIAPQDHMISNAMLEYFTTFAKTGTPASATTWPAFVPNNPQYMLFETPAPRAAPVDRAHVLRSIADNNREEGR